MNNRGLLTLIFALDNTKERTEPRKEKIFIYNLKVLTNLALFLSVLVFLIGLVTFTYSIIFALYFGLRTSSLETSLLAIVGTIVLIMAIAIFFTIKKINKRDIKKNSRH